MFNEIADEIGDGTPLTFVNIRETAGWSKDAAKAGPKMAALIAASAEPVTDVPFVSLASDGVALLYGKDERAIEAANLLKDQLDITVLIKPGVEIAPPRVTEFPVVQGESVAPRAISAHLKSQSMTMPPPAHHRVARLNSEYRAMARYRVAISFLIFPAARRCSRLPICGTAIYAPIRAILPRSCARCSKPASSPAHSTSRAISILPKTCARIRVPRSSVVAAASISAPPAQSCRPAIMSPSTHTSAPVAGNAPRLARRAPPLMPCLLPMR